MTDLKLFLDPIIPCNTNNYKSFCGLNVKCRLANLAGRNVDFYEYFAKFVNFIK